MERERGIVYLVMDWSDGGSLRELLDELPNHRLALPMAVRIVARVCSGLHAVHELVGEDGEPLGVVHRDVSPQNVLISTKGQVRITDFGVAKARGQVHAPTQTGEVKGKIAYMAPEQVTTKDIDRRADVFALGCVLYEASTGQRPFQGGDALATLYALLEQPLIPPSERMPGYPTELEALVLKALARDRGRSLPDGRRARPSARSLARQRKAVGFGREHRERSHGDARPPHQRSSERDRRRRLGHRSAHRRAAVAHDETRSMATAAPRRRSAARRRRCRIRCRPKSSRKGLFLALGAGALIAGGVFAFTRESGQPEHPVADSARPAPAPDCAGDVRRNARSRARDHRGDAQRGARKRRALSRRSGALESVHRATLPRDGRSVTRCAPKADGFADAEEDIVFDQDRDIRLDAQSREEAVAVRGTSRVRPTASPAPTPTRPPAQPTSGQQDNMPVIQRKIRTLDSDNPFAPK